MMVPSIDNILEDVAGTVGLEDFGDISFREGLEHYIESAFAEAKMTALGASALQGSIRSGLGNRLKVIQWHKENPDARPVEAPIFIVGLSRTGTTALSHLLAQDPQNRSLLMWEAMNSTPPPKRETYASDPRFEASKADLGIYNLNPALKSLHYDPPDAPTECSTVLGQHFTSLSVSTLYNLPSYDAWLTAPQRDFSPAYAYHRQVLQLLQSECGGRWQLKYPGHGLALEGIAKTYPDARFVVTHRDPVTALASVCSVVRGFSGLFSDADHREYIGKHWTHLVSTMVDRVMDYRDRHGDANFYDVDYRDLVRTPVEAVRKMYDHFRLEFSEETEAAFRKTAAERPQGKHGRHEYSLSEFGLNRDELRERFSRYYNRYNVSPDAD